MVIRFSLCAVVEPAPLTCFLTFKRARYSRMLPSAFTLTARKILPSKLLLIMLRTTSDLFAVTSSATVMILFISFLSMFN
ncbi:unknown [Salmonella phage FelixO1]|uniref:Uncharacterized protein n=1 Tax=Salmonella phage Felix O1 (isolate Felix O1-VT1) TaxID=1283336 RepID=Q6KGU4_BPFO1|nr:unknown [Salmonella phage FelixO1]